MKEHIADRGRSIRIYDDVFSLNFRHELYSRAIKSSFKIGWEDNDVIENSQHKYLHARYSAQEIDEMGVLFNLAPTPVFEEIAGHKVTRSVLNLSTPADVLFLHTHTEDKVILYYINLEWQSHWYGETLFYDEALKNIVLATPYTPGRVIVFDGKIPHTIRPQSHSAPFFRFTLTIFLEKIRDGKDAPPSLVGTAS